MSGKCARVKRWSCPGVASALLVALLFGACQGKTAQTTSENQTSPEEETTTPAPGTARVRAKIDSCSGHQERQVCHLLVETVVAYGMSTPPLGSGQKLRVEVPKRLSEAVGKLDRSGPLPATLRFQGQPTPSVGSPPSDTSSEDADSGRSDGSWEDVPDWTLVEVG